MDYAKCHGNENEQRAVTDTNVTRQVIDSRAVKRQSAAAHEYAELERNIEKLRHNFKTRSNDIMAQIASPIIDEAHVRLGR